MTIRKNRICINVTPRKNDRQCFIEWGDGSRSICRRSGMYWHEYDNKTADYTCNIINAYDFSIGSGETEDYSKEMVKSIPLLEDGLGRITDGLYHEIDVSNLKIPDSVESIGASAFCGCSNLENLNFPASLSSIGEYAFDGCSNLRFTNRMEFSSLAITSIPEACFRRCYLLNNLTIPQSITTVGASAFYGTNLIMYDFPRNITDIGDYAFYFFSLNGNVTDNTLYFDSHVNRIGDYAFYYFDRLRKIKFENGVDYIGKCAFEDCRFLSSVEFYGDVGTIECSCFSFNIINSERYALKNVFFDKNVDTIGDYAFSKHSGLTAVELPEGIRKIGDGAFMYCENISSVQENGVVANSLESIGDYAFYNQSHHFLSSFSVGDSLTSIGDGAFMNCANLSSFNFGNNLAEIGNQSFLGCTNLFVYEGKFICPESLIKIGERAFYGCKSITSAEFNDYIDEIPSELFYGSSLVSVNIGNRTKTIGDKAFYGCKKLKNVNFGSNIETIGSESFRLCTSLEDIIMPNSTENIGAFAFYENTALSSIHFSDSLTSIGDYAFNRNYKIKNIELPDSLISIGKGAFGGASLITSLRIPDSVENIGSSAFAGNKSLNDVYFGSSIKSIGDYAFSGSSLSNILLNDGLEKIGNNCFRNCGNYSGNVNIPSTVSSIGNYAFSYTKYDRIDINSSSLNELPKYCFLKSSIATYKLPQSLKTIGENCFSSCHNMSSINLPSSLSSIEKGAFVLCSSLKYLKFENSTAPSLGNNVFGYSGWDTTWAGYGVKGSNIITIPRNSSGYINSTSYEPWLMSLVTNGGFDVEIEN